MKSRILAGLAALLIVAGAFAPLFAEVTTHGSSVSVTSTSATTSFTYARTSIWIKNDDASANELYFRLFHCGDTAAAATTSSIRLDPGEAVTFEHDARSEAGLGYCALTYVTAAAETATLRYIAK